MANVPPDEIDLSQCSTAALLGLGASRISLACQGHPSSDEDRAVGLMLAGAMRQRSEELGEEAARERERIAQKLERAFSGLPEGPDNLDSDSIIAWVRDGAP